MKNIAKLHIASSALIFPLLARAHPGHEGHDLTWSFHGPIPWESPIAAFLVAMLASALVFRFAFNRR